MGADEQQLGRSLSCLTGRDVFGNLEKFSPSLLRDLTDFSSSFFDVALNFGGKAGGGWSNDHADEKG